MTLGDQQRLFMTLLPRLIDKIHAEGYECTIGDAYRHPKVFGYIGATKVGAYGHPRSAHKQRLAVDINLFKNGVYLVTTEDHELIGTWWEQQHPLCRWGGRFNDGNHYSMERNGVK